MGVLGWLRAFWQRDKMPDPAVDVLGAATLPSVIIPPKPSALDAKAMQARGYRNKNPGNIDFNSGNKWVGQVGIEPTGNPPRFAVFDSHEHGIRALARLLQSYQQKHKLHTIAGIINRWAPPNENVTSAYVNFVSRAVGIEPNEQVDVMKYAIARPMVEAIIRKELGGCPYPPEVIDEGLKRAGVMP